MKSFYRFCPKCGGNLEYKKFDSATHPQCQKCGFVFYINAKPAVGAFVVDRDKILLTKRAIEPSRGKWDFLGGFLETSEHPIDGLKREVKEETGVNVKVGVFLGFFMDEYRYGNIIGQYVLNVFYICALKGSNFKLDPEILELKWFGRDEIPWDDLAFKNTRDALNYYLDDKRKKT